MVLHNYCAIYSRKQNPALRSSFENTSRNIFIQKKQSKVTPTFADSSLCRGTTGISSYTSSISNSQSNVQASNTLLHEYYYQVSNFLMCIVSMVNFNGFVLNPLINQRSETFYINDGCKIKRDHSQICEFVKFSNRNFAISLLNHLFLPTSSRDCHKL